MYYMYLDTMQIGIPPASIKTNINNKNKTIDLLGKGEVNIIKNPGLTTISFKFLLPNSKYPFDQSILGIEKAPSYLDKLEELKLNAQPFQFIMVRMKDGGEMINISNIKVTLEGYTIEEDANNGYDMYANISLKKYVDWGAKKIEVKTDSDGKTTGTVTKTRSSIGRGTPIATQAGKGQTLQQILKQNLGNTNNLFAIAKLNKIAVPAILGYGQTVKIAQKSAEQNAKKMVMY